MTKKKDPKDLKKTGRPTKYSKEVAEKICSKVSVTSAGLMQLYHENDYFPHPDTIYEWRSKIPEFSDMYAQAKKHQADILAEQIIEMSDNCAIEYHRGSEYIMATRLQVDSRKWMAAKLLPRIYGDKVTTDNTHTVVSQDEAIKLLK